MENKCIYTAKDFKSDQEIRWCAGCGDHAIINSVYKAMAETGVPKKDFAVISGIGCSSRFPYYMSTYAFHTIHGRALAIATGAKLANPKISVWNTTGDGDGMAIGGNHFIHAIRRNIDINVILFNNRIYGLTKGQYSPTSEEGKVTKTSPFGTIEQPFNPGELVIGASGKFFARAIDNQVELTKNVLFTARDFDGTAVVEVLQNCVIFNDGAYNYLYDREERDNRMIYLEHGKPMIYGKNRDMGLVLDGFSLKSVKIGENGITEKDIVIHDKHQVNPFLHLMLVHMSGPDLPVAMGVIREIREETLDQKCERQIAEVKAKSDVKTLDDLFNRGDVWEVK